ncbi:MAG: hypothetical protein PWP51_1093 [Clostridiales bacterium]|nr:hypothetical protein [Clostridiales bacterium]
MHALTSLIDHIRPVLDGMSFAIKIESNHHKTVYTNNAFEIMQRRSGSDVVADTSKIVIDDHSLGCITVFHDVSDVARLKQELDKLDQKLRKIQAKYTFKDFVGNSPALQHTKKIAQGAAKTTATIMIRGESGTGKEIFANAIHNASMRRHEKFIKVNCASIPEALMESELFGYSEGAFTGALKRGRKGLFQEAHRGTLFLDEIGDISANMQVKLLRVLQEREVMRVGSAETESVDVRIISATNKPLETMVENGLFREDLYYRLNVIPIHLPPLRERLEDIEPLLLYLLNQYNDLYSKKVTTIDRAAIEYLQQQSWRGNVRELENVLTRALIRLPEEATVLEKRYFTQTSQALVTYPSIVAGTAPTKLSDAIETVERQCIASALARHRGDKNRAAHDLDIPLRTLYYKCKKLGI